MPSGSKTEIANKAIRHLGQGVTIEDLDTSTDAEAKAVREYYDTSLDAVLSDFPWHFATVFIELGLVEEDPTSEWAFSYQKPSDCVMARRIFSGNRNDTRQSRVSFRVARGTSGDVIFTDMEDACLEYTKRETDVARYPADFVLALSYKLAELIAPSIRGANTATVAQMRQLYELEIRKAQARAAREDQPDEEPKSEFERSR